MCEKVVEKNPRQLKSVPDCFRTQEMCSKAVEEDPYSLEYVPDHFKPWEIYDDAVWGDPFSLVCVLDWFVTQQRIGPWDDDDHLNDDELIEWYNGYQKRKVQKARIEKELMRIAWHPSRWGDWCIMKTRKKRQKTYRLYKKFFDQK